MSSSESTEPVKLIDSESSSDILIVVEEPKSKIRKVPKKARFADDVKEPVKKTKVTKQDAYNSMRRGAMMNTVRSLKTLRVVGDKSFNVGKNLRNTNSKNVGTDYFQTLTMRGVVSNHLLDRRQRVNSRMANRASYLKAKHVVNKTGTLARNTIRFGTMAGTSRSDSIYKDYGFLEADAPDPERKTLNLKVADTNSENFCRVTVTTITGDTVEVDCETTFYVKDLFKLVVSKLDIYQFDMMGIALKYEEGERWIDFNEVLEDILRFSQTGTKICSDTLILGVRWWKIPFKYPDNKSLNIFYEHLKSEMLLSKYQISEKVAVRLAALQMSVEFGPFVRATHKPGYFNRQSILKYLPEHILEELPSVKFAEMRIFSFYRQLLAFPDLDEHFSKRLYIQFSREAYLWGVTFYSGFINEEESEIGICEDGVFFKSAFQLEYIPFSSFFEVSVNDDYTILEIDFEDRTRKRALFETNGNMEEILELLNGYYAILLAQDTEGIEEIDFPISSKLRIPDPTKYTRPLIRISPEDSPKSMLYWFRKFYTKLSEEQGVQPNSRLLLQVANRLDNEELLDIIDLRSSNINNESLKILYTAYKWTVQKFVISKLRRTKTDLIPDISIHTLVLADNQITDGDTLGRLISLASVRRVDISYNRLGIKGAEDMAVHIEHNAKMEEFVLVGNEIQTDGLNALLRSLKNNPRLLAFTFQSNLINKNCKTSLAKIFDTNKSIRAFDISDNPIGDDVAAGVIKALRDNKKIEYLNFANCELGVDFGDRAIALISKRSNITGFKAGYNNLGSTFGINFSPILDENNLVVLDLRSTRLGTDGTTAIFQGLSNNRSIAELILNGNETNKQGIQLLADFVAISTSIQKLGLRYCGIEKKSFTILGKGLQENSTLTSLDLSHNKLSSIEACMKMSDAIGNLDCRIVELNLSSCCMKYKQLRELSEGFSDNQSIQRLFLDGNDVSLTGIRAICFGLSDHEDIEIITLQDTNLRVKDVIEAIRRFGRGKTSIGILDVRKNPVEVNEDLLRYSKKYGILVKYDEVPQKPGLIKTFTRR
eukprot:TRINITY_DN493_c0_g1_i1.p1 TRINITY_DN493_c0_g1~~TRINITY_DN493_c0_g1_i1.p1  ORF type:complete len:1052 (-),score=238.04 TRINITY_DN493_c0_g1_i1:28-3183(-)